MSIERLELSFLKKIDKRRYVPGTEMAQDDIGLDRCWRDGVQEDAWHVGLYSVSTYASMEQVREYILGQIPGTDMSSWSLRRSHDGGAYAAGDGWALEIPAEAMRGIETVHSDFGVYMLAASVRDIELSWLDREWAKGAGLDGPLDQAMVRRALAARQAHYAGLGPEGLEEAMDMYGYGHYGDPVQFLQAGIAYAKATGTKAWASLTD